MAKTRGKRLWTYWGVLTLFIGGYLTAGLLDKDAAVNAWLRPARVLLLPGKTTHAHHQIELACETCHTKPFAGPAVMQDACVKCHGDELAEGKDTHPASKFDDPRNANRLEKINAQLCITCHQEHRPDITRAMAVTVPDDVCSYCHSGDQEVPADHKGFRFDTCRASGCHNFHNNRALYEDFLLEHAQDPWLLDRRQWPARGFAEAALEMMSYPADRYPLKPLTAMQADAPADKRADRRIEAGWLASTHARWGVNCSACHVAADGAAQGQWNDHPDRSYCVGCHDKEVKGFLAGMHGSSLAQGLPPVAVADAQIPMRAEARDKHLSCTACHGAHRFETRKAAVESCLGCHSDKHTLAYKQSPHYKIWQDELAGRSPAGSGVSCAGCHLPRVRMPTDDGSRIVVQHNQYDTLHPEEKMIRPVCMTCHGLGFSIDALADQALIDSNFTGKPSRHVASIEMAIKEDAEARRKKTLQLERAKEKRSPAVPVQ